MDVVDAVEVHVLRVPGKRGLPHAKVQVCSVDPFNLDAIVFAHTVEDGAQLVDVPAFLVRVRESPRDVCPIHWIDKRDVLPVLSVQLFVIKVLRCLISATMKTLTE